MAPKISPEVFPPGEYIREELEARGWTQTDLAKILGWWPKDVSRLITGKQPITLEAAKCLAEAFGTSAQLWMNLETSYQLSKRTTGADPGVAKRAKIYSKVPVSEMQKRGWIESTENADVLEAQVLEFYGIPDIDHPIVLECAARMPEHGRELNQFQLAWLKRAQQIGPAAPVMGQFSPASLDVALSALAPLRTNAEDVRRIPEVLACSGIRLVIVETLPHTNIDGACFWLNPDAPVIVLSFRYDRIDWFWHTLVHELKHVSNRDGQDSAIIDMQLVGEDAKPYVEDKPQAEKDADLFAIGYLVDQKQLDNFIARVHPLYSHMKILSFADRIGVHPGIVVGQLHFRKKISYAHSRKMLVKARAMLSASALTDGWGHVVPVGIGGI
jgi:HTH-type transcriptional regulator / antitoxin HigA